MYTIDVLSKTIQRPYIPTSDHV